MQFFNLIQDDIFTLHTKLLISVLALRFYQMNQAIKRNVRAPSTTDKAVTYQLCVEIAGLFIVGITTILENLFWHGLVPTKKYNAISTQNS